MPNSFEYGSSHPGLAAERTDRFNDRPENMPDTGHILHSNTPDDTRAAFSRHDADRQNEAANAALPRMQIINTEAFNHTQISMEPFDRNHDNHIDRRELQQTIGDRRVNTVGATEAAVALYRNFDAIATLDQRDGLNDTIGRNDMAIVHNLPPEHPLARQINHDMAQVPGNGLNEGLFDRRDGVTPAAVRESDQLDDSPVTSSMRSLARHEPGRQLILQNVQQDGNTVRVRLGNGETITTPRPTSAEMGIYAPDSGHGTWPNAMERGVGMSLHQDPLAPQAAIEQLDGQAAMQALVGNRGNQTHIELHNVSEQALHTSLSNVTPTAMLMTADHGMNPSTLAERVDRNGRTSAVQLNAGRTYEFERYDSAARTVYLRNGQNETIRMPLQSFQRNFRAFNAAQPPR